MNALTRRQFLGHAGGGLSAVALAGTMPMMLARAAQAAESAKKNDRVLLTIELAGGNDGLNTVVPFENPRYYRDRPTLAIAKAEVLRLSDQVGFNPALGSLHELFKDGKLSVVQGVGYPNPDRSHFRSMEIWHTASTDKQPPTAGWLGRYLDRTSKDAPRQTLVGLTLTSSLPQALYTRDIVVPAIASLEGLGAADANAGPSAKVLRKLSTSGGEAIGPVAFLREQAAGTYRVAKQLHEATARYQSKVEYPDSELGQQLRRAAQIVSAGLGTRVLFASQGGYDTHANQAGQHQNLLADLAAALAAFQQDLKSLKVEDRVLTMVFSEFGRRVDENSSQGTDHGAASNVFLLGSKVKGGLAGEYPSLEKLGDGDLIFNTDFRSVYATILDRWLGAPSEELLRGKFPALDVLA